MKTVSIPLGFLALSHTWQVGSAQSQPYAWKTTYPSATYGGPSVGIPIPDTNSQQVKTWVSQIDLSKVPTAPVVSTNPATGGVVLPTTNNFCDWSVNACADGDDIVTCPGVGQFGLSFDDGPTQYSPQLYDFLDQQNQKASLFYIGAYIWNYPLYAKRGCASNHQIGLHTWSHHPLTTLTNEQIVAELKWSETIIKELCGFTPKYMRPPYGDMDDRVRSIVKQLGYKPIIWDWDTNDWQVATPGSGITAQTIDTNFTNWINSYKNNPQTKGHICLEHELSNVSVSEAIKWIPQLKSQFKSVSTVAACIGDAHPYVETAISQPILNNQNQLVNASSSSNTANSQSASSSYSVSCLPPSTSVLVPAFLSVIGVRFIVF